MQDMEEVSGNSCEILIVLEFVWARVEDLNICDICEKTSSCRSTLIMCEFEASCV